MFSFAKLPKICLAAVTLGCLGVTVLPLNSTAYLAETEPRDPAIHRGSGRAVVQVPQQFDQGLSLSYRGTGRLHQTPQKLLAHRGSGRVTQGLQPSPSTFYRGSGRVVPMPVHVQEWV